MDNCKKSTDVSDNNFLTRFFQNLKAELRKMLDCKFIFWNAAGERLEVPGPGQLKGRSDSMDMSECIQLESNHQLIGYLFYDAVDRNQTMDNLVRCIAAITFDRFFFDDSDKKREKAIRLFLRDWIFESHIEENEFFYTRGKLLGIDVTLSYTLLLLRFQNRKEFFKDTKKMRIIDQIVRSEICENPDNLYILESEEILIFLNDVNLERIRKKAQIIKEHLEAAFFTTIFGGVSSRSQGCSDFKRCYKNADLACETARQSMLAECVIYDDLSLAFVLRSIPEQIKHDFVKRVFPNLKESDPNEWISTLKAFFDCNGSINQAAEQLFVHKNTLQYRINKISEETGYNPRNTKNAFVLYLALMLREEDDYS